MIFLYPQVIPKVSVEMYVPLIVRLRQGITQAGGLVGNLYCTHTWECFNSFYIDVRDEVDGIKGRGYISKFITYHFYSYWLILF
jgi:hypothetical protein